MSKYKFDCGCSFDIVDDTVKPNDGLPGIKIDYENIPEDCPATWQLIQSGHTKGVFQLETNLGRKWAKELAPTNITEMAALVSLMRPGCISGETKIMVNKWDSDSRIRYRHMTMKELYDKRETTTQIMSYNEKTGELFRNNIDEVIYTGKKMVYRVKLNKTRRPELTDVHTKHYNLMCTADHKLLTPHGWVELKDLKIGDRFAIVNWESNRPYRNPDNIPGQKNFRDICFKNYEYHCVFCNWKKGSLDVNHLDGNRKTNNDPDNLCFMCPNHHRMYSEHNITKQEVIEAREEFLLPQYPDIMWAEYQGAECLGEQDVYDVCMEGPHHNFIAGKTVVHNCLRAIVDGKSMTQHYCDRKNAGDEIKYFHPALEPILRETYGVLTYQEQSMRMAQDLAGASLQEADILRKAIGKKKADIMAKVKPEFIQGCVETGLVTEEEAEEIFGWIQESQRYSFNKSHGVSYGLMGYWSAYVKAHFPYHFYTSWLYYSHEKMDPQEEMQLLISDARYFDIEVRPPSLNHVFQGDIGHFALYDDCVYFGIGDIKRIGDALVSKVTTNVRQIEEKLGRTIDKWTWSDFLLHFSDSVTTTAVNGMIASGATDYMKGSRVQKIHEYETWKKLTQKERDWIRDNYDGGNLIEGIQLMLHNKPRTTKSRIEKVMDVLYHAKNAPFSLEDTAYYIAQKETELLGVPITCTKLDTCSGNREPDTTCKEFLHGKSGKMSIAVEITEAKEYIISKGKMKGQKMMFIAAEDSTASLDSITVFPRTLEGNEPLLIKGSTVLLTGQRDRQRSESFIVDNIVQI